MPRKRDPSLPPPIPRRRTDSPVFRKDLAPLESAERSIVDTFHFMVERIPEETWEGLSYRKKVCMRFLKWFSDPTEDNLLVLVEMTKAWRKHDRRTGGKRTLLEVMIRKRLLKRARKITIQREEKIRGRSPERLEQLRKNWEKHKREGRGVFNPETQSPEAKAKARALSREKQKGEWWVVTSPWGQIYHVQGLRAFCEEHGLNKGHLGGTAKVPGSHHKGWRARKKVEDWPLER